jgi:hypothetical protein
MLQNAMELDVSGARMADLDEMLASLLRRREKLQSDLAELEKAIKFIEQAKQELSPDLFSMLVARQSGLPEAPQRTRGVLPPRDIALAARDVLLTRGKPMKRGEIVEELVRRGIPISGKDPNKNLGTILWRHPEMFVTLDNLGYWVKDTPLEGMYKPG